MKKKTMLAFLLVMAIVLLTACGPKKEEKTDFSYVMNSTGEWVRLVRYNGESAQVVIPDQLKGKPVKEIGAYTFAFSPHVTEITIPASITKIDDPSFSGLPKLEKITVAEENIGFVAIDNVLFHKKMKTVYCYPQGKTGDQYTLPDTVTTIAAKAFYHSQLKELVMPDTVTKILASAFEGASLETVAFSQKLSQIHEKAFADCKALTGVVFPDKLTSIAANSFSGCASLKEIVVPASVGVMDAGAFENCASLESVQVLTKSVQRVSDRTFAGCTALKKVEYAAPVLGIGNEAFTGCAALESFLLTDSITTMGRSAFEGCVSLEGLYIPDTLMDIGAHALDGTPYLQSLSGDYAVTGGGVLLAVRAQDSEITVPEGVKRISFTHQAVEKVTVPEGVGMLNNGAFYACAALREIVLPDSLTGIGAEAFRGCTALETFTVSAGVTAIGEDCFRDCTGMKEYLVAPGNVTFTEDQGVLYDNSRKTLIWYPSNSEMTTYTMPYGPVGISNHAVENVKNLEVFDASAAQDVQAIGDYVFANCPKLRSVKLTENFARFGAHSFEGDTALSDFSFTAVMTLFGEYSFAGCTSLGNQTLSATLGKISAGALEGTTGTYTVYGNTLAEEFVKTWDLHYTKK